MGPETRNNIDVQELFFCYRQLAKLRFVLAFVCIICYLSKSATIKLTNVFMVAVWWFTVDFDLKCKILWGETRAHGYLFMRRRKKHGSKPKSA